MRDNSSVVKIEIHIEENDLINLVLRDGIEEKDILEEMSDITDMYQSDIEIASVLYGTTAYEICTTNNRYNLYLFKDEQDEDGNWITIAAHNILGFCNPNFSGYGELLEYISGLL